MPNHIHGIIQLVGADCIRPNCMRPHDMPPERAPTVGDVVRGFKSSVTKRVNALPGASVQRIWQRNYYEHIIRNEDAYLKIAEYIQTNPQRWEEDTDHV